jgi:hypothetical protein
VDALTSRSSWLPVFVNIMNPPPTVAHSGVARVQGVEITIAPARNSAATVVSVATSWPRTSVSELASVRSYLALTSCVTNFTALHPIAYCRRRIVRYSALLRPLLAHDQRLLRMPRRPAIDRTEEGP